MKDINKTLYFLLSFTWGLPMTLIGCIAAVAMIITGHKPKRFGWAIYFEIGKGWGGVNLGPVFICNRDSSDNLKAHEFGHSIQNCYFGPLMIFIVAIPSATRYWIREWKKSRGVKNLPPYDSIWFEGQATELGERFIARINKV